MLFRSRIFEWVARLAGLKNIAQFKSMIAPDAQLLQQAKLGNVVPLQGKQSTGVKPAPTPSPAQLPGIGPTI